MTTSLDQGGIEQSILRFLNYAVSQADYTLIVRSGKTGVLYDEYKKLNINIIMKKVSYYNPVKWWKIYTIFKNNEFDVVCDYTGNFAGIPLSLAKYAGINKRVVFYRASSNHYKTSIIKNLYNKRVNRLVYNNATTILANSQTAIKYFFPYRQFSDKRFRIINNSIDSESFNTKYNKESIKSEFDIPTDAIVVGHTGRYSWPKNFPTILQVAQRICKKYNNVYFICCGQHTDCPDLTNKIKAIGLSDRIKGLGFRNDIPRILSMYDLFYFPSLTEGQPNSLLEALIAGLPIVASNIECIAESIPPDLHSQLVDPTDVESACQKIEELILHKEKRETLNRKNWAKEKYDYETQCRELQNILLHEPIEI